MDRTIGQAIDQVTAWPHEALVVCGFRGTRIVKGHGTIIFPMIENCRDLSLELASPLSNVDKITVVSTGNGDSAGLHKITGDMTTIVAQIPALFETLSGMQISELLSKIPVLGDKAPRPDFPKKKESGTTVSDPPGSTAQN